MQLIKFYEESECLHNVSLANYHNCNKKKAVIADIAHKLNATGKMSENCEHIKPTLHKKEAVNICKI